MAELILQLDDQLATRLSNVAREHYEGDSNAVVSDALHLLFLQPIHKDRRRIAKLIDETRTQVHTAGGITEKEVDQAISGSLKVCKDVDDDKFREARLSFARRSIVVFTSAFENDRCSRLSIFDLTLVARSKIS